jgi:hypothetical protein
MNYKKIYNTIISNAQNRVFEDSVDFENHHFIPRCLGGKETVPLTLKEHFICHYLLTKIYPDNYSLLYAFFRMSNLKKYGKMGARSYERIRKKFIESVSGQNNKMFGICAYDIWIEKYGIEEANKMKEKANKLNKEKNSGKNNAMFETSVLDIWIDKYGVEEAHKMWKDRNEKLSNSLSGENSYKYIDLNIYTNQIIFLYEIEKKSLTEIGKLFNCSRTPIKRILDTNNIKLRTSSENISIRNLEKFQCPWCKNYFNIMILSEHHNDKCKLHPNYVKKIKNRKINKKKCFTCQRYISLNNFKRHKCNKL